MIRTWMKSIGVGLGAAVLVGAVWIWLGIGTKLQTQNFPPPQAAPSTGGAPDDITVITSDTIVSQTTSSDPYVGWVVLITFVLTSTWSFRRLRKIEVK
jgi:hypothetical protein